MSDLIQRMDRCLASIGAFVIYSQTIESVLRTILELALPGTDRITLDTIISERDANAKATIGRLLIKLRKRADIHPDFDNILNTFLENRNNLIHDASRIEGFDLHSDAGLTCIEGFLSNLVKNAETVMKTLTSLLVEWSDETGIGQKGVGPIRALIDDLEGHDVHAASIFFAKPNTR